MSETAKFEIENPQNEICWVFCSRCGGGATSHRIMTQVSAIDETPDGQITVWDWYEVIQCQGCHIVSFCHSSQHSEAYDFDPKTGEQTLVVTRQLFPSRVAGRPLIRGAHYVPHGVYRIYKEAHGALANQFPVMAGFGVRAIVEAVCKDRAMAGRNLKTKIDALADANLITKDGAKILHGLRFLGNKAAHEMKVHSEDEMGAAFDVVEHLLQSVYILPRRAEHLPQS